KLIQLNNARTAKDRLAILASLRPGDIRLAIPSNGEPRTRQSMGDHQALTALEWQNTREAQDELAVSSHHKLAATYDESWQDDLISPFRGRVRDDILSVDSSMEKLAMSSAVFCKGEVDTMTAANSIPLTDGASAVLLGTDEWAEAHGLEVL